MPYKRFLPLAALIAAFWPVWSWISVRAMDDSGDAWELLSLATVMLLLASTPARARRDGVAIAIPIVLLTIYAATHPFLPPLLRAAASNDFKHE